MNRRFRGFFPVTLSLGIALHFSGTSRAQTAAPPLSLGAAQEEARRNAPEAAEIAARLAGADAVYRAGRRVFRSDPEVSAGLSRGSRDEGGTELEASLTLDPLSPAWGPRRSAATADLETTRAGQSDALRALDESVAIAVAQLALAQRRAARQEQIASIFVIAAAAAEIEVSVGRGSRLDSDAAHLDAGSASAEVAFAKRDLAASRADFARLLGRADSTNLSVQDLSESEAALSTPDLPSLVEGDPRVRSAVSETRAALLSRRAANLALWPAPTLSAQWTRGVHDIPAGSFQGTPNAAGLSARWRDTETLLRLSIPLPLFDRLREPRALATQREREAAAHEREVRADVLRELQQSWAALVAAREAIDAVRDAQGMVERDLALVEQAVRAGSFSSLERGVLVRRLEESGERADRSVFELRTARARWIRRADAP